MASTTTMEIRIEPTIQIATNWTVPRIRQALDLHELGQFYASGLLWDHIRRDPKVFSSLETRVLGMLGLPFELLDSDDGDQRKARSVGDRARAWWPRQVRKRNIADFLRYRIGMGLCPGELLWSQPGEGASAPWIPRPKIWHPMWLTWFPTERIYKLATRGGLVDLTPGDGTWLLLADGGDADRPWMQGAIRSLAIPWIIRQFAQRDWARASEVYGMGVRKAKVPSQGTDAKIIRKFFADVKNLANEPSIKLPEGFDLEIMMIEAQKGEGFERLMDKCESAIVEVLLGQSLTTQAAGGSYARAEVSLSHTLGRYEADVDGLGDWAQQQILGPWADRNEGDAELAPRPFWDTDAAEDKNSLADRLVKASTAISQLVTAGAPIDTRALLERLDIPVIDATSEEIATRRGVLSQPYFDFGIVTVNEARADRGLPALSKADGGDELVVKGGASTEPDEPPPDPAPPIGAPSVPEPPLPDGALPPPTAPPAN